MEIINSVIQIVQSLGFPIAMCLLLFFRMSKQDEIIDENTKVLAALKQLIEDKMR